VLDWQETVDDTTKFIDALRCEIVEQQIHVFTEAGQAVLLPMGATPVDLAYTVDPNLGHACVGASINGRLAPLSSLLDEGDVVEIITRGNSGPLGGGPGPAREWLEFARSPQARLEINRWFETPEPVATVEQRMRLGRATIGLALHEQGRRLANERPLRNLASDLGYPDVGALLVAVADRRLPATEVANRLVAIVDRPI